MLAGASGTILTNPLWVVKTRFMVSRDAVGYGRMSHPVSDLSRCTARHAFR